MTNALGGEGRKSWTVGEEVEWPCQVPGEEVEDPEHWRAALGGKHGRQECV